ncbi:MAG TPA: SIS domain-containing protein [Candidatus Olsenella pullicola]|nr:SIS domain-containing protein [Candidatus Olsenella pullicola]
MKGTAERFKDEIISRLNTVFDGQEDALHEAAVIFADTIERGGIIRAFGSGHSHANALEICGRAGGYIQTKVVREPAWGIYEMIDGVGDQFWLKLDLRPEDCLVVISNSGRNPLPVELAMHAQEAGVKVIAVTAVDVSRASTSRSKSGKRLFEVADVVLDNKSTFGDAALEVDGLATRVGGTSLYTGCLLLDCAVMESYDILLERGVQPPLFMSANVDGGPEFNQRLLDQFKERLAEY